MPDLLHTLHEQDLGFLKIIAAAWGLELQAPDAETALPLLVAGMSNRLLAREIIETLPDAARQAIYALLNNQGQLSLVVVLPPLWRSAQPGCRKTRP